MVYSTRVNALMMRALDAELVLVAAPRDQSPAEVAGAVAIAARGYGALAEERQVGCILNRVCTGVASASHADLEGLGPTYGPCAGCVGAQVTDEQLAAHQKALLVEKLRPVAIVPCNGELCAPRTSDVAAELSAKVLAEGEARTRRVRDVAVCAMTVSNVIRALKPGTLVITPGDRNDVLLAAAMTATSGTALAGVLLTGGLEPDLGILDLCKKAFDGGLPLLQVKDGSYGAATRVSAVSTEIPSRRPGAGRADHELRCRPDRFGVAAELRQGHPAAAPVAAGVPSPAHRGGPGRPEADRAAGGGRAADPRRGRPGGGARDRPLRVARRSRPRFATWPPEQGVAAPSQHRDHRRGQGRPAATWQPLVERRKSKGMTPSAGRPGAVGDTIMVGTMMMALDEADGLVSGAVHTTAHTIRPALQIIRTTPGCNLVSSVFFMCLPDQVLVFGDCAVNPNPKAEELADIAIQSAESAIAFGIPPRVAMLSYSTGTSGTGEEVEKVKAATAIAQRLRPDLPIDGPLQYDAAMMPDVARQKAPGSKVAGQATVLIFPDLNTGNVSYKAVQRSAGVVSIGPMLQGLAKPVNDLSRGCLVEDIVFTIALTAIQAQQVAKAKLAKAAGAG